MQTVFLYGPPGVGKLTVGTELATLTGFKLFHIHLSVNLVSSVFPFHTEPWGRLLNRIQRDVFAEAMLENVDLVTTGGYSGTAESAEGWLSMFEPIRAGGGTVLNVQLICDREELFRRVQNESRRAFGKLTDPHDLALRAERADLFASLPFEPHLRIDTTHTSPMAVAYKIATHFSLPHSMSESGRPDQDLSQGIEVKRN